MPVEYDGHGVGRFAHRGGADDMRSAGVTAFQQSPEELDRHLGSRPGAGRRVVRGRIDVQHRVQVRVERGEHRIPFQRVVIQRFHLALLKEERGPQPVLFDQALGGFRERDAVRGGQRLPVPAGDRKGHIRAWALFHGAQHPPDESRVQERHVGRADEREVGSPAQRRQPGGDTLHRALTLARVVGYQGALRQLREVLAGGADDDNRAARRARHDPDRPAQQGGPVPLQGGLGRAHPG
jgi:hypothetical protein